MFDGSNVSGRIEFGPDGELTGLGQQGTWKVRDSLEILIKLGEQEQVLEFDDVVNEAVVIDPPTIPMSRLVLSRDTGATGFSEPHNQKEHKDSSMCSMCDKAASPGTDPFAGFGGEELDAETRERLEQERQERLCIDIIGWNSYY